MCHYSVYEKLFNIKLSWVLRGMMDVFHVYCFKSVGIYKHKLSRIESLVILYWRINCISIISLHICDFSSKSNGSIYIPLRLYCYIYCKFKGLYEHQQETKIVQLTIRGSGKHKQTITKLLALPGGIKNLHFQEQWG